MSRRLLVPALLAALGLALPTPLLAHGGGYVAPTGPTGPSGSGTAPGPGSPFGAPSTPTGGSAGSGGLSKGPSTGVPPSAPAYPTPAKTTGPTSGNSSSSNAKKSGPTSGAKVELASTGWQYWWEFNKDQYLNLKSRTVRLSSKGYVAGHLTGRGRRADPDLFIRPDPVLIRREVLPLLMRLLDEEQNRDILDSSMLALARSSDEDTAQFVIDALLPFLAHDDRVVQCAAALSLGVLGSPRAVPSLTAVMRDTSTGRKLARATGPLDQSVRASAALGLGLVNEPDSVDALCKLVRQAPDRDDDLKGCAIAALGLMDNASSPQALTFLLGLLDDRRLDPPIKSHVPPAIGKLCNRLGVFDPAVDRALLEAFRGQDTDDQVRQSVAIALGLVGTIPSDDLAQDEVLATLLDYCARGRDDATREFCFIAVAQIGRRDPAAPEHPAVHQALRELFVRECVRPTVAGDRAWAALGAAIYGLERAEARPDLVESLIQAWSTEGDPSYKSAFALALGLLGAQPRASELFADLQGRQDQELNGVTALALGFMRHGPASDTLRELCRSKAILAMYRTRLATSLALLADDGADEALIELLGEGHAVGVCAAGAKALGLIGGTQAVATLQTLAADARERELVRAFACVALGMICEKTALPWNARLLSDTNFRSLGPTLQQVFEIL